MSAIPPITWEDFRDSCTFSSRGLKIKLPLGECQHPFNSKQKGYCMLLEGKLTPD